MGEKKANPKHRRISKKNEKIMSIYCQFTVNSLEVFIKCPQQIPLFTAKITIFIIDNSKSGNENGEL